jgi:uncharacterized RDD family membrane protein YckC
MVAQNEYGPSRGKPDDAEASMTTTQQPDPFGATSAALRGASGPRAGFWIRGAASFLDLLVLLLPFMITAGVAGVATGRAVWWVVGVAYFVLLEGGPSGQTLGKKLCGIRVIDLPVGGRIGVRRALIRALGRWVSFAAFMLGYLWMLWDPEKQTWHDKMGRAVVVPVDAYPRS